MDQGQRLRMVPATPLDEDLCVRFEELEPRVELVRDHSVLPPMRHAGDHSGDPAWHRTPEEQARCDALGGSDETAGIPWGAAAEAASASKRACCSGVRCQAG